MSDLLVVGLDQECTNRVRVASIFAQIDIVSYKKADDLFDITDQINPRFMILSTLGVSTKESIAGEVQSIKQFYPKVFVMVVVEKKMTSADAAFLKKSGANYVILENEFLNTIRLEYFLVFVVKASLTPIKVGDLKVGTVIPFPVQAILPLNEKVVPVVPKDTLLSQERYNKLTTTSELYVGREDLEAYLKYYIAHEDKSAKGLAQRCRVQFQTVANAHVNLMLLLTDQSESGSFDQGKQLLEQTVALCSDLLMTLSSVPEPWNIIDQSVIGAIGATDRSMVIASLAALTSFIAGFGVSEDIMLAGLFCDLGLLDLSPRALGKLHSTEDRERLNPEDLNVYNHHPLISLNRLLERKMQLSEKQKEIILCTHEQVDKKGFPKRIAPEKIPIESSMILFHELVDFEFRVQMGKQRISYVEARQIVFDREYANANKFSLLLLEKIKSIM